MITIYTTNSCASCRKAVKWLKDHNIDFKEYNFFNNPLTKEDLLYILNKTDNGFDDIISTRSKVFSNLEVDINDLKFNEVIDLILKNPSVLKRPLIVNERNLQIGYNDEDIEVFIPKELRDSWCSHCEKCEYKENVRVQLKRIK